MTDEMRQVVNDLRCCVENKCYSCKSLPEGTTCWQAVGRAAADLIEELAEQVEVLELVHAGLDMAVTMAESAAETWQRRAEAAERDILRALYGDGNCCDLCAHRLPCLGADCPDYECGVGATDKNGNEYPDFEWSCKDFDYGECAQMEDTPCHGCYFRNHFKWRGPCEKNGGVPYEQDT